VTTTLRQAFRSTPFVPVRITSHGFLRPGDARPVQVLEGSVTKMTSLRTRFDRGRIVCSSNDGDRNAAGALCTECLHPRCRLQLRIHLRDGNLLYVLHLNIPSANNLFDLDDDARHAGEDLWTWRLRLTILDHGHWNEVTFQRTD